MADKKNIVIRVNYPKDGSKSEKRPSAPELVTEWHVKRIVLAVTALALLCALPFFVINHEDQNTAVSHPSAPEQIAVIPPVTTDLKHEPVQAEPPSDINPAVNAIQKSDKSDSVSKPALIKNIEVVNNDQSPVGDIRVSRALLTTGINHKEPIDEFIPPVKIGHKKSFVLYYFTELKNSKERALYHEWLRNGQVAAKRQLYIGAERWRTSSRMTFSDKNKGNWSVRLVDKSGHILNKISFNVVSDE